MDHHNSNRPTPAGAEAASGRWAPQAPAMYAVYDTTTQQVLLVPSSSLFGSESSAAVRSMPEPGQLSALQQAPTPRRHQDGFAALRGFLEKAEQQASGDAREMEQPHSFQAPSYSGKRNLEPQTSDDESGPGAFKRQPGDPRMHTNDSKEKNKQAQRRFRARQKEIISELEQKIQDMTGQANQREQQISSLREENNSLKRQLNCPGVSPAPVPHPPQCHGTPCDNNSPQLKTCPSNAESLHNSDISSWTPMHAAQQPQQGQISFVARHLAAPHQFTGPVYISTTQGQGMRRTST